MPAIVMLMQTTGNKRNTVSIAFEERWSMFRLREQSVPLLGRKFCPSQRDFELLIFDGKPRDLFIAARFLTEPLPLRFGLLLFGRGWLLLFCSGRRWSRRDGGRFLFSFFRFFFRRFLFYLRGVNPLDKCDWCRIALTLAELNDASVTAISRCSARRDVIEQFFDGVFLPQHGQRGTPRVDRTVLAQRHHFFRERANGFRFRERGFNALVLDQAANLIGEQCLPMFCGAAELDRFLLVSHARMK